MSVPPRFRAALSILGTLGLLFLVGRRVDLWAVLERVRGAGLGWFVLAALLGPLQVMLGGLRWSWVDRALGGTLGSGQAVREYALSTLLNQVLPGGMAGDAVRVWRQRAHAGLGLALKAAVVDRWSGLWVLSLGALFGLLGFAPGLLELPVVVVAALALSAVLLLPVEPGPSARRTLQVAGLPVTVGSVVLLGSFLLGFALVGFALGRGPGGWLFAGVPLLLLAMALPVSVGGWGLREASAVAVLPRFGWTEEDALALSALYGISVLVGALPGGVVLFGRNG